MPISQKEEIQAERMMRDEAFAKRLAAAVIAHPIAPDGHGRVVWLQNEINKRSKEKVSPEAVRKWFKGYMRPKPAKMEIVADILNSDAAWLSLGIAPGLEPRERRARNAMADGAVNLVAGLIQTSGGRPAFPEDDDRRASQDHVDVYAIIKGANFAIHVSYCEGHGHDGCQFVVPNTFTDLTVVGVVKVSPLNFDYYELEGGEIEKYGTRKGGAIEVMIPAKELDSLRIVTFGERNFGRG